MWVINKRKIFLFLFFIQTVGLYAKEDTPFKRGNLSLPTSQQPGALFGFGQNVVDKSDCQFFTLVDQVKGRNKNFTEIIPAILFGASDKLSLFFNVPLATSMKLNEQRSSGLEDIYIQAEYAFYTHEKDEATNQATAVCALYLPTGSVVNDPATGAGSAGFFFGFTVVHMGIDWYFYTSHGVLLTTPEHGIKIGNQFLYQGGMGKNFIGGSGWIVTGMIEINGSYTQKDTRDFSIDSNSGGNLLNIGPTLWISSKRLIIQGGIQFPVYQKLFGTQNKNKYIWALNVGWKF